MRFHIVLGAQRLRMSSIEVAQTAHKILVGAGYADAWIWVEVVS
jgi:hypothetical protein